MGTINYIKHLNAVFVNISKDSRLNPTHISLYFALFYLWNVNFFRDEFYINRDDVMKLAKIGSKTTYHRCIKELNHWMYFEYLPSHNSFHGSKIRMFNFCTNNGQVMDSSQTKNCTSAGQALVSINKHIQTITNQKNNNKQQDFKNSNLKDPENLNKLVKVDQYLDNLGTATNKNYNEPL
ncbi:hypothetical protein C7447_101819 [Tenacibaculum adriaticum]|uniref:Uncharacterized protein n=1 Tax=Tenacibaculum adriaticum TaxID=413713 RepID=A0A5S5DY70_9FLAO|nr:hypothetical protein [Tenacibaculum adriaticum]TYQ00209.1 hypothetical protein C7447_101819 [Tenacibaculum adriaticum]